MAVHSRALHLGSLVRWELRHLRGRRRGASPAALLVVVAAAGYGVWWLADRLPSLDPLQSMLSAYVAPALASTPFRDPILHAGQLGFGYALLRLTVYLIAGFARVSLPTSAAGMVVDDRRTGRSVDLDLTQLRPAEIYLAKVAAAALPFGVLAALLYLPFAVVAWGELVPPADILRLALELTLAVLLPAALTVTCSATAGCRAVASIRAYLLLWIALPALWILALAALQDRISALPAYVQGAEWQRGPFGAQWFVQFFLSAAVLAAAGWIGIRRQSAAGSK